MCETMRPCRREGGTVNIRESYLKCFNFQFPTTLQTRLSKLWCLSFCAIYALLLALCRKIHVVLPVILLGDHCIRLSLLLMKVTLNIDRFGQNLAGMMFSQNRNFLAFSFCHQGSEVFTMEGENLNVLAVLEGYTLPWGLKVGEGSHGSALPAGAYCLVCSHHFQRQSVLQCE